MMMLEMDRRRLLGAVAGLGLPHAVGVAQASVPQDDRAKAHVAERIGAFYAAFNAGAWSQVAELLTPTPTLMWRKGQAGGSPAALIEVFRAAHANGVRWRPAARPARVWLDGDRAIKRFDHGPLWFPNDHTAVVMVEQAEASCRGGEDCWGAFVPYEQIHVFTFLYSGNEQDGSRELFSRINLATEEG